MGLSLDTFLGLTPQQFELAYDRWIERIEADDIQAERRARLIAFRIVCPPEGKKLSIYDFWYIKGDEQMKQAAKPIPSKRSRFEELKNKWQ